MRPYAPAEGALLRDRRLRRAFVSGLLAATAFGAVIGTAIGFVAGASPLWASPSRTRAAIPAPPARRATPPPPTVLVPRPDPEPAAAPPVAALTPLVAELGGHTTDGEQILARVQGLVRAGLPLVVESRHLSVEDRAQLDVSVLSSVRLVPTEAYGRVVGIKVYGVRPNGALDRIGLRNGDVILAIDGVDVAGDPTTELGPFPGDRRMVVVEIDRRGEDRILVVRW